MKWRLVRIKKYPDNFCKVELCVENIGQFGKMQINWFGVGTFHTTNELFDALLNKKDLSNTIVVEDEV